MQLLRYLFHRHFFFSYAGLSLAVFFLNAFLSRRFWPYFMIPSVFSIAFFFRAIDDIVDFTKDQTRILTRKQLMLLAGGFAILFLISNFLSSSYLMALLGIIIIAYALIMQKHAAMKFFIAPMLAAFYILLWWGNDLINLQSISWVASTLGISLCLAIYKGKRNADTSKNRR